ncbi:hypothetical protein V8G54_033192 [Vigna mungo]|uniref:Uncharacterized protein n=1 Tax=Vigna mungo TaxID=3915 RepID=A0AAQ3MMI1_VIGMU
MPRRGFHGMFQLLWRLKEPVLDAGEVGGIARREASQGSQERDKAGGEGGRWGHCRGIREDESSEIDTGERDKTWWCRATKPGIGYKFNVTEYSSMFFFFMAL